MFVLNGETQACHSEEPANGCFSLSVSSQLSSGSSGAVWRSMVFRVASAGNRSPPVVLAAQVPSVLEIHHFLLLLSLNEVHIFIFETPRCVLQAQLVGDTQQLIFHPLYHS